MIDNDGRNEALHGEGHEVLERESVEGLREGQDQIPHGEDLQSHEPKSNGLAHSESGLPWNELHSSKYSRLSVPEHFVEPEGDFLSEEDLAGHRQIVSGLEASSAAAYPHFDLLPDNSLDTSIALTASLDQETATGRPAWLLAPNPEDDVTPPYADAIPFPNSAGDRVASRWFALKRVFHQDDDQQEPPAARSADPRIPSMVVFSMAGGVGKTSLVATLGRALAAYGERVLLVDTTSAGLLPFYFGAKPQSGFTGPGVMGPGVVRTFTAAGSTDAPVNMVSLDPDQATAQPEQAGDGSDNLVGEINIHARGASRILIDLASASGPVARRLLKLAPTVLVPLTPEMNSVVSLNAIEALFHNQPGAALGASSARRIRPYYLINQFDPTLALHLDIREVMRQQLGDRLLPFTLRRNTVVSEAVAQGMTVMDYAPGSSIAEDYMTLASWMRNLAAPSVPGYRGVRWSERSV